MLTKVRAQYVTTEEHNVAFQVIVVKLKNLFYPNASGARQYYVAHGFFAQLTSPNLFATKGAWDISWAKKRALGTC